VFKASDLQRSEFDEPKFIIPGLVPEGITLLSGTPKIGKSWMLLGFGVAVSTGGTVFSDISCNKATVLYLALEDTPRRLQSRLRMVMGWEPFPEDLFLECEWNRFPVGIKQLDQFLEKHPEVKLVMIDTLEMVRPPRRSNPYEDDYRALSGLRTLASTHRCAFVVVHHNRKTSTTIDGTEIDPLERVSGTMGLTGSVDTILVLSRFRGTGMGTLNVMGRDVREQELVLQLDKDMGLWVKHEGLRSGAE
jgi:RecA-family ATPase